MTPRPKLRTFCRWMLTILTVMLVVVWIGSGWYTWAFAFGISFDKELFNRLWFSKGIFTGSFQLTELTAESSIGFNRYFRKEDVFDINLWSWGWVYQGLWRIVKFPLWIPSLLLAIPTALMWRTHIIARRRKPGMCTKCGYDITGLVGTEQCPECGTQVKTEIAPAKA